MQMAWLVKVLCIFIVRFLNYCSHPFGDFFLLHVFSLFFLQMYSVLKDVLSYCSVCILTDDGTHLHTLNCTSVPPHRRMEVEDFGEPQHLLHVKIDYLPLHVFSFITRLYAWVWWCANNIQFVYGNLLLKHQILSHALHFYL